MEQERTNIVSNTAEQSSVVSPPGGTPSTGGTAARRSASAFLQIVIQQREITVFVIAIALGVYFRAAAPDFLTKPNLVTLSQTAAPWAIIGIGEVLLLVCGEMDLSVGFILGFSPFFMHYMIDFWGVPALLAIVLSLGMGVAVGAANGVITVFLGVPSFITTLGTGFILQGIMLTTSHAYPATIPASAQGIGHWLGTYAWAEITWAIVLVAVFHIVLTRMRWGLHTISVGGNILGASEAGISIAKIKIGNFMITGFMGALVGMQEAFRTNSIDPSNGSYTPMFYAIAGAVIGGTALAGGSGTIIGAFLGAILLAELFNGFNLLGISANPQPIILGSAILIAMIANVQLARLRRAGRAS
jgi:simple sugar transport system permease protein